MSIPSYQIEFTHAAVVDAQRYDGGLAELEVAVRREIDGLLSDGLDKLDDLFFHTLMEDYRPKFFITPQSNDKVLVDACEEKIGDTLESGPLAGKRLVMPKGFTA